MLKKLLRYDFKSILKFWWIAAVSTLGLAVIGGWSVSIFENQKEFPEMLYVVATLAAIIAVLGGVAFAIMTIILLFSRFYKNFFTDEGYLTFTLPVKRATLLNSKLIASVATVLMTGFVILVDILIAFCIAYYEDVFTKEFWMDICEAITDYFETFGAYAVYYIIQTIVSAILTVAISVLFAFCCITIASIIAKKAKVITAIAIYYVANSAVVFGLVMYNLFAAETLYDWFIGVPVYLSNPTSMLMSLCRLFFSGIFCVVLYCFQYWMLDRKLNLS
ncbi:MAG: hypothetical protein IKW45_02410 [Clostridia bacterium]|nr:hypothetical protein [Clostridia bacterium]